jgi:hypothetical protein
MSTAATLAWDSHSINIGKIWCQCDGYFLNCRLQLNTWVHMGTHTEYILHTSLQNFILSLVMTKQVSHGQPCDIFVVAISKYQIFNSLKYRKWTTYVSYDYHIGTGWGTALQTGRSWVRFPMESLGFFCWLKPSGRTMSLGSTQSLKEMSITDIP